MAVSMAARTILLIVTFLKYSWTAEIIKVGVILPNGTYPFSLQNTIPALQMAVSSINKHNFLPSKYAVQLSIRDSECSETHGPLAAIELYTEKNAHVFIGPACDYAVAPVARFSSKWGIPVLTPGAMVSAFSDKTEYKLLTRLMGSYTKVGDFVINVLQHYSWTHVGLIYSDYKPAGKGKSDCFFTMEALYMAIKSHHGYTPWHLSFDVNKPDPKNLFDKAKDQARILILCAAPDHLREFIIHAYENDEDNDFVFINVDLFNRSNGAKPWYKADDTPERNEKARKGYEALLSIGIREPTSIEYKAFSEQVKRRGRNMYLDYEDEVNNFVAASHDALLLYALALNDTINAGGNITDGVAITSRMWGRTFQGITGTVSIDENGDRNMDYCLMDMNPATGVFEVVAYYYGNRKMYEAVVGKSVHWAGERTSPPTDEPECGFDGSKCRAAADDASLPESESHEKGEPFPKYGIVLIVLGSLLVLAVATVFVVYRWKFSNYYTMSSSR